MTHDLRNPPPGGWTLADVQELPEGSRVEVLDGSLIVNPSPLPIHQRITRRLAAALEDQLPGEWQLEVDVDVMLAEDPLDYLTPDVVVFRSDVSLSTRPIPGKAILLAVEVVSKGSRKEDRGSKPLAYAEAGIPCYWRVEGPSSGERDITVHAYELGRNQAAYRPAGVFTGRLTASLDDDIDIDINLDALT